MNCSLSQTDLRAGSTVLALNAAQSSNSGPVKYWMKSHAAFLFLEALFIANCQTHSFDWGWSPALTTGPGANAILPDWLLLPATLVKVSKNIRVV